MYIKTQTEGGKKLLPTGICVYAKDQTTENTVTVFSFQVQHERPFLSHQTDITLNYPGLHTPCSM